MRIGALPAFFFWAALRASLALMAEFRCSWCRMGETTLLWSVSSSSTKLSEDPSSFMMEAMGWAGSSLLLRVYFSGVSSSSGSSHYGSAACSSATTGLKVGECTFSRSPLGEASASVPMPSGVPL